MILSTFPSIFKSVMSKLSAGIYKYDDPVLFLLSLISLQKRNYDFSCAKSLIFIKHDACCKEAVLSRSAIFHVYLRRVMRGWMLLYTDEYYEDGEGFVLFSD